MRCQAPSDRELCRNKIRARPSKQRPAGETVAARYGPSSGMQAVAFVFLGAGYASLRSGRALREGLFDRLFGQTTPPKTPSSPSGQVVLKYDAVHRLFVCLILDNSSSPTAAAAAAAATAPLSVVCLRARTRLFVRLALSL